MRRRALIAIIAVFAIANILVISLLVAASHSSSALLPTVALLPSETATAIPATSTDLPTLPTQTATPTPTPTLTLTVTMTFTESPIPSLSDTPVTSSTVATRAVVTTATQQQTQQETLPPTTAGSPVAVTIKIKEPSGTQARSGPGISYGIVKQVAFDSVYTVHAYAKDYFGHVWYLVNLPGNEQGWILEPAAQVVTGNTNQVAIVATIPATPTLTPTFTLTPANGLEEQLQLVPVFSGIGPQLRDIYFKGQRAGNRANVVTKVGDCNSVSDSFLSPLDKGAYRLGRYAALQQVISRFKGSFSRASIAAQVGFNVITVQDSMWSDRKYCGPEESPIDCEYRVEKPSIAIIMFGANDVTFLTPKIYRENLEVIITRSIDQGIIPVLMTFTWHDQGKLYAKMLNFNLIVADLADKYHVPLINFWLAAQYLPDHGIEPDNAHLSLSGNGLDFTGEQMKWGHTLRSFLVLEMLDRIQTELGK